MSNNLTLIKGIISDISGVDPAEVVTTAYFEDDLNIDELELIEILTELEDQLEVELVEDKENIQTVQDLMDLLLEKLE